MILSKVQSFVPNLASLFRVTIVTEIVVVLSVVAFIKSYRLKSRA